MPAAQLHCLGVVSAKLLGVKYSSSSPGKSYGTKDDGLDPEVVVEVMILLLKMVMGLLTGTH